MLLFAPSLRTRVLSLLARAVLLLLALSVPSPAQTTVSTGSIVGSVTDPSGAVVSGANATIINLATGQVIRLTTNVSGAFNSGALVPGDYKTLIAAKGFNPVEAKATVLVGNTSTVNVTLRVGPGKEVLEVQDASLQVNTEQAAVQGILTEEQIENLPVNGRNFLDLAQLEPGVQIQDAVGIGKYAFSSFSFEGRFGRATRV